MKENNTNLLILASLTISLVLIGTGLLLPVDKPETTAQAPISAVATPTSATIPFLDESQTQSPNNVSNKQISGVTLSPLAPENVKAVKSVKNIKALSLDINRTINIYGPVDKNAHQASAAIRSLNARNNKDPIYLVLYSPGGSVVDGAALISAMQVSEAPVYTVCYTFCASMAAMIHQYGKKRYITDRSILMFHPASFGTEGEVDKMFSQISMIRRYINKIEMEVSARMKLSFQEYKLLTAMEYWVDSEDGLKANAADDIVYIVPTSIFKILPAPPAEETEEDVEDKKKNKTGIEGLQWIYKQ